MAEPVSAKVSMISPALDPGSATVEVWLTIDNKSGALKVGTPVRCSMVGKTVANALKIPLSAVSDGRRRQQIRDGGCARRHGSA